MSAMIQGSNEWHEFRRKHIGASDSPAIMELDPFCSLLDKWEEKVGLRENKIINENMLRGIKLEPIARQWFIDKTGIFVEPDVVLCKDISFMMASLDGISKDKKIGLEIKCHGKSMHTSVKNGYIPDHVNCQIQHTMYVCEMDEYYYLSYCEPDPYLQKIKRDNKFIEKLLNQEKIFWDCVENFISPYQKMTVNMIIDRNIEQEYQNYWLSQKTAT